MKYITNINLKYILYKLIYNSIIGFKWKSYVKRTNVLVSPRQRATSELLGGATWPVARCAARRWWPRGTEPLLSARLVVAWSQAVLNGQEPLKAFKSLFKKLLTSLRVAQKLLLKLEKWLKMLQNWLFSCVFPCVSGAI